MAITDIERALGVFDELDAERTVIFGSRLLLRLLEQAIPNLLPKTQPFLALKLLRAAISAASAPHGMKLASILRNHDGEGNRFWLSYGQRSVAMPVRHYDLKSLFTELVQLNRSLEPRTVYERELNLQIAGATALELKIGEPTGAVFGFPTLPPEENQIARRTSEVLAKVGWDFWQRWYEGMHQGKPLLWDLQREVALIDDEIWKAGPEAVAEEIARIEARFELLRRIEELEAERDALKANRFGIGGNQPPEPIEDPELAKQVTIIWDATNTVKKEAEKDQPDKSVVETALGAMIAALKWIWKRIESAADSAVALVMGIYIGNPAAVERVIEAIKNWLLTF